MKLKKLLLENHEVLKGKIIDWDFGAASYQLEVLSSVRVQYRIKGRDWTRTDIVALRDFKMISLEVKRRSLCHGVKLYLVTDNEGGV